MRNTPAKSTLEWAFLGTTAAQAIANTALQLFVLDRYLRWINAIVYQVPQSYIIPVTFAIFVLGVWYQFALSWDSLRIKNNIQLFAQAVCNICFFASSILLYHQVKNVIAELPGNHATDGSPFVNVDMDMWGQTQPAMIAFIGVFGACSLALCGLAYRLHREFAWALYKNISADRKLRGRYLHYEILLVLMKLAFYFLVSFVIIYDFVAVHYRQPEFALTLAIIPLALIQVSLSAYFTRVENRAGMIVTIVVYLGTVVYLVWVIAALCGKGWRARSIMRDEMVFFALIALTLVIGTLMSSISCMSNFGHGLKPQLLNHMGRKKAPPSTTNDPYAFQRLSHSAPPPRDLISSRRFDID